MAVSWMRARLSALMVVNRGSPATAILKAWSSLLSLTVTTMEYACLTASGICLLAKPVSLASTCSRTRSIGWSLS